MKNTCVAPQPIEKERYGWVPFFLILIQLDELHYFLLLTFLYQEYINTLYKIAIDFIEGAGVPTLSQWAMIALSLLLAFAGATAMRRRKAY